jgi:hypothetical protein
MKIELHFELADIEDCRVKIEGPSSCPILKIEDCRLKIGLQVELAEIED